MFLSILLPLSRNLTPSLCTTSHVHKSRRWQTVSLFALSELVCTKNVFYPILLFPLLSHPKLLPLWSVPDGRTNLNTPLSLNSFFFSTERAGPYPQAQLYWAGRTMGWMADWTRYHKYARVGTYVPHTNTRMILCVHACTGTKTANLSKPTACMNRSIASTIQEHGKI